jgi:hypothetical protein
MSLYENDRRRTPRHRTQLAIRVLVLVTKRTADELESVLTCNGYTHDISESGLALIISARSINETFLDRGDCKMQVVLTLPVGCVEITAIPVRYEHVLGGETNSGQDVPTDDGFLVGMLITEISDEARARYLEYIRELSRP